VSRGGPAEMLIFVVEPHDYQGIRSLFDQPWVELERLWIADSDLGEVWVGRVEQKVRLVLDDRAWHS
jgi:hypothetical protein